MKHLKTVLLVVFTTMLLGCSATKKMQEPNAALDQMMNERAFNIKVKSAEPQLTQAMSQVANSGLIPPGNSISRIDVTGSGYYIKVQGDSVSAELPYFGERQMGGGYDSDAGIHFEGIAKDLEISKDETKQNYTVRFSIDSKSEVYFVTTIVGNNATSTSAISSSQRNRIRYSGDVQDLVKTP